MTGKLGLDPTTVRHARSPLSRSCAELLDRLTEPGRVATAGPAGSAGSAGSAA